MGAIITLVAAYGIFKGLPWSRVLYLVYGVVGVVTGFFMSPSPLVMLVSVILLVKTAEAGAGRPGR